MIASITATAALVAIAAVSADPAGDSLLAFAQHRLIAAVSLVLAVASAVTLGIAIGRGTSGDAGPSTAATSASSPIEPAAAQIPAEAMTRAETEFLANMSHELRTPLNAVIGFAELILSEVHGPLGDRRYVDYVSHIRTGGKQLQAIVDAILDLSQLAAGQLDPQPRRIEPQAIAEECARPVAADRARLKQVLSNLLSNGIGQSSLHNGAGSHRASSTGASAPDAGTEAPSCRQEFRCASANRAKEAP